MGNTSAPSGRPGSSVFGFVLLLLLLGATGAVLWVAWRAFTHLESGVATAVVGALATVLLSLLSLIYSRRAEQQRLIEQQHREQKLPIYEDFMRFWFRALMHQKTGEQPPTELEMAMFLSEFTQKLILWGDDTVLLSYSRFRANAAAAGSEEETNPSILFGFERLLFTIRRDLGHRNRNLAPGTLLSMWITDVDALDPSSASVGS